MEAPAVVGLVLVLVLWGFLWQEVASVRRELQKQTRYLERMGRAAGWLPPEPPKR